MRETFLNLRSANLHQIKGEVKPINSMYCTRFLELNVKSEGIVVSVLASGQMTMVKVLTLVPMLVDFDMYISHSIFRLRHSSLSSIFILARFSSLAS